MPSAMAARSTQASGTRSLSAAQSHRAPLRAAVAPTGRRSSVVARSSGSGKNEKPVSDNVLEGVLGLDTINEISKFVTNSPLNQGKKWLAKQQAGDYDAAAIQALIEETTRSNPVVVFSWTTCPFCTKAKALLTDLGVNYVALELNQRDDGAAIRAELAELTDRTSMPNVFIAGTSVGGCNDGPGVMTLQAEGKLVPMVQEAGGMK